MRPDTGDAPQPGPAAAGGVRLAEEQDIRRILAVYYQQDVTTEWFAGFDGKELINARGGIKNAMLFNTLSFFSHKLLTEGNTVAALDELYMFLSIPIAIEYIRSFMKRVRKKDSAIILASQNLEDFTQPGLAELTRPLLAISTHHFLFNAGNVDGRFFTD